MKARDVTCSIYRLGPAHCPPANAIVLEMYVWSGESTLTVPSGAIRIVSLKVRYALLNFVRPTPSRSDL